MRRKGDENDTAGKTGQRMVQKAIRESGLRSGVAFVSCATPTEESSSLKPRLKNLQVNCKMRWC